MNELKVQSPLPAGTNRPQAMEWFWWGVLCVSLLTGFFMTLFAPI